MTVGKALKVNNTKKRKTIVGLKENDVLTQKKQINDLSIYYYVGSPLH